MTKYCVYSSYKCHSDCRRLSGCSPGEQSYAWKHPGDVSLADCLSTRSHQFSTAAGLCRTASEDEYYVSHDSNRPRWHWYMFQLLSPQNSGYGWQYGGHRTAELVHNMQPIHQNKSLCLAERTFVLSISGFRHVCRPLTGYDLSWQRCHRFRKPTVGRPRDPRCRPTCALPPDSHRSGQQCQLPQTYSSGR